MTASWLGAVEFADAIGVSRQAAAKILRRASEGLPWNGAALVVRRARGRGGRSGTRYEVTLSSLPGHYQEALRGLSEQAPCATAIVADASPDASDIVSHASGERRRPAANQWVRIEARWRAIEDAVAHPPRSAERSAEIARASRKYGHSIRTLQRWISDLEASGGDVNALARRKPADAGRVRTMVSRRFDKAFMAAGYGADRLQQLGERVDQLTKAAWASEAQRGGWRHVRREILTALKRECREQAITLPKSAFHLSLRRVVKAEHYRVVDIYQNDRKRFDDAKPRIRRDNSKFAPMQQVVMDVKPLDVLVCRPDGSTACPRMIGFLDTGTHRLFRHFVLPPKGEAVRQEHVIEGFAAMASHPEWGFPQQLYRDNGTEFYMFDLIQDALRLVADEGARTIINAKPYQGASKPIESKFAVLDRFVFSQMEGWIGGNRMNKKVQTVGRPRPPYPGSFADFVAEANKRILDFESVEIASGPFKGRSPAQCYQDHVEAGWRPVRVHPNALDAAFCKRDTRRVDRGTVSIDGTRYFHPELPNRRTVTIALPYRRGALPLVDLPDFGWTYLNQEMLHLPGDIAGAIESSRLQSRDVRRVGELRRHAGSIDLRQNLDDRVAELPTRAAPAPLIDILMSSEAETIAAAREAGDRRLLAAPTEAERRRARRMAETEELEAYFARKQRN